MAKRGVPKVPPELKDNVAPKPKKTATPERKKTNTPERKKTNTPERKKTNTPERKKTATPEPKDTVPPEPKDTVPPEPKDTVPPEPKDTVPPEPKDTVPPEPKDTVPPEPKDTVPPEPKDTVPPEPKDTVPPEPKDTVPPEPKCNAPPFEDPLNEFSIGDINSLEFLFARDLITYVMRRRVPHWNFGNGFEFISPVTPFSFRIQNAIEHYLIKEDVNIYFLFAQGFSGMPFNYHAFICATSYIVDSVYPNVHSPNDLLRLLALFAQYTVLAYKRGIHMAPYYSLIAIQDLLYRYIKHKGLKPSVFYANLGIHAENLIRETPMVPHELLL